MSTIVGKVSKEIISSSNNHTTRGITTGLKGLDEKLSGLHKTDLIILAARPSIGKTSLALDIARKTSLKENAVGILSLEMSSSQLVERMLSSQSNIDSWKIRTGRLKNDEKTQLADATKATFKSSNIY